METEKKKKKRKGFGPLEIIILTAAVGILTFSICQLLFIQNNYSGAREEYDKLADTFVESTETESAASEATSTAGEPVKEKKGEKQVVKIREEADGGGTGAEDDPGSVAAIPVPFSVDWAGLKAVNSEIVGWIHIDALPHIHYPICKGPDNSYYLNHTFRREVNPSGSLFMDKNNAGDFSNALTFVYGHRMDDHSMFGDLRSLENPSLIDANPRFWIYTPEGVFCYRIFSVFEEPAESDVFAYHFEHDKSFLQWTRYVLSRSVIDMHTTVTMRDKVVVLSTCTTDRVRRCLVFGKCISVDQPGPDEEIPVPEDEKAPGREQANAGSAESKTDSKAGGKKKKPSKTPTPSPAVDDGWELPRTGDAESFTEIT